MNSVRFKNKYTKPFFCLLLSAVLVFSSFSFSGIKANASIRDQISALENEQSTLKNQLNDLKSKKSDLDAKKKAQQKLVDNMQELVNACNRQLDQYNSEISELQAQIDSKEAEIEDTKTQFKRRIRATYMSGMNANSISIFLSSDNFSDILAKNEMMNSISTYDQALIEEITKSMKVINKDKAKVEKKQKEQKEIQQKLSSQLAELNGKLSEIKSDVNSLEEKFEMTQEEYNKQQKELSILQQKLSAPSYGNIKFTSGRFTWPVPGLYNVYSGYGYRNGTYSGMHWGIDISGGYCLGKPIVAAADGVVIFSGWGNYGSGYGGYGNVLHINHGRSSDGNNYSTLYGHMQYSPLVKNGQSVKAGQTVGYIGSTGQSTGPHLHFEVIRNGSKVNPMNYFS